MERKLHKIDAAGKSLGRLASNIALILRGKNKPEFRPHLDCGDIVEVDNVEKVKLTGKKIDQKEYHSFSGYPGGLKTRKISDIGYKGALEKAVREMLPPVKFRKEMLKRLIIR
jgi:large subunit ribosomal protein L13